MSTNTNQFFEQAIKDMQALPDETFIAMAERMGYTVERTAAAEAAEVGEGRPSLAKPRVTSEQSTKLRNALSWTQVDPNLLALVDAHIEEIARLQTTVQIMVAKAVSNHRPAYDEQQMRIMRLEDELNDARRELARRHEQVCNRLPNSLYTERCKTWAGTLTQLSRLKSERNNLIHDLSTLFNKCLLAVKAQPALPSEFTENEMVKIRQLAQVLNNPSIADTFLEVLKKTSENTCLDISRRLLDLDIAEAMTTDVISDELENQAVSTEVIQRQAIYAYGRWKNGMEDGDTPTSCDLDLMFELERFCEEGLPVMIEKGEGE